jgi:sodium/bile acid cotransporter 7
VLVGSQKTLPIAVTVLGQLGGALPDLAVGLAVIPCVVAHLAQILVDSLLVSHWLRQDARRVPRAA